MNSAAAATAALTEASSATSVRMKVARSPSSAALALP
jgi:hypothetical protein